MFVVEANLKNCQTKLRRWSTASYGNITRALVEKKKQVVEVEEKTARGGSADWMHMLKAELRDLLSSEEKLWQQRSELLAARGRSKHKLFSWKGLLKV